MTDYPDLSPAELAFRALLRSKAYTQWAAATRAAWLLTPAGILAERKAGRGEQ